LDQRFTLGEVERITGTTRRQLEYWSRLGLVHPRARWGERFFNFTDLVAVETLNRLSERRVRNWPPCEFQPTARKWWCTNRGRKEG
jgi:MerR HTH family regulatory protein